MRLTIWQFVGLVVIVAVIWYVVFIWSPGQNKETLIDKMNSMFLDSEEERQDDKPAPPPASSDGWVQ